MENKNSEDLKELVYTLVHKYSFIEVLKVLYDISTEQNVYQITENLTSEDEYIDIEEEKWQNYNKWSYCSEVMFNTIIEIAYIFKVGKKPE